MSIREHILKLQLEVGSGDLLPERAAEILTELSSLLGNVLDEIRARDMEYNKKLLEIYETEKVSNRAKLKASVTSEYENMRIARDTKDLVVEMIRGLKYFIKSKEEEYKTVKYQ